MEEHETENVRITLSVQGCAVMGCVTAVAGQTTTKWQQRYIECEVGVHNICCTRILGQDIHDAEAGRLCSDCHTGTSTGEFTQAEKYLRINKPTGNDGNRP